MITNVNKENQGQGFFRRNVEMSKIVTRLPNSLSNFITKSYFKGENNNVLLLRHQWYLINRRVILSKELDRQNC